MPLSPNDLRAGREEHPAVFMAFTQLTSKKGEECLYFFLEGHENNYYVGRIRKYTENYQSFSCRGRKAVLEVHRLIASRSEYEKYKKAFFIDRDFNPPLSLLKPPIFETPCYSVENFYVSPEVFEKILENVFHLSPITDKVSFEAILDKYKALQEEYNEAMLYFNAWYACLMDIRNSTGQSANASLDEKPPKGFVRIKLEGVEKNYELSDITSKYPSSPSVTEEEITSKINELRADDLNKNLRGKYALYFLIEFIKLIIKDAKPGTGTQSVSQKELRLSMGGDGSNLSAKLALDVFSTYAETPESLDEYLVQVTAS